MTEICLHCRQYVELRDGQLWSRVGGTKCVPAFSLRRPVRDAHEVGGDG